MGLFDRLKKTFSETKTGIVGLLAVVCFGLTSLYLNEWLWRGEEVEGILGMISYVVVIGMLSTMMIYAFSGFISYLILGRNLGDDESLDNEVTTIIFVTLIVSCLAVLFVASPNP